MNPIQRVMLLFGMLMLTVMAHDYGDALTKSILFFEGQRSGKLPPSQRMTWRKDSALRDGFQIGVSMQKYSRIKVLKLTSINSAEFF